MEALQCLGQSGDCGGGEKGLDCGYILKTVPKGCGGWVWSIIAPLSHPCRIKRAVGAKVIEHKEGCPVRPSISWVLGSSSPYGGGR